MRRTLFGSHARQASAQRVIARRLFSAGLPSSNCGFACLPRLPQREALLHHRGAHPRRMLASSNGETMEERNQRIALYMLSVALATLGVAYASVPLYKVFCQVRGVTWAHPVCCWSSLRLERFTHAISFLQATGFGGTTQRVDVKDARDLSPVSSERGRSVRHFEELRI